MAWLAEISFSARWKSYSKFVRDLSDAAKPAEKSATHVLYEISRAKSFIFFYRPG